MLSDTYLPYALGGGYVISGLLSRFVVRNMDILSRYNAEDVSMGTWLAPLNITRRHDVRFDTEWKSRGCQNKFLVTHKQSPSDMRAKADMLSRSNGVLMCQSETHRRKEYVYNWAGKASDCCPGRGKN